MKRYALELQLSCVLLLISVSHQLSTIESDHYVAAVVGYKAGADTDENLAAYIGYMAEAALQDVDIIVFPEASLIQDDVVYVEVNAEGGSAPCDDAANHAELLVQLSCAARQYTIYAVVNLNEGLNCTESKNKNKCSGNAIYHLFNTNVVFDRTGKIIDRYRKINLFDESEYTQSLDHSLGVFPTDFGVTFGHFICFDLILQVPAMQVVQKLGITDVILSTMWFSNGPFLTAVEIQQAYARSLNVNFLAAGANEIAESYGGSGIYSGAAGALVAYMPSTDDGRMLVAKVPKVPGRLTKTYEGLIANDPASMDRFLLKQDQSIKLFASQLIEVQDAAQAITVTHGEVVCNFEILTDTGRDADANQARQKYYYRAVAFDGLRTSMADDSFGIKVCAVLACQTQQLETCGSRFPAHSSTDTTLFNRLSITATLAAPTRDAILDADSIVYFPVSLQNNILPLTADQLTYEEASGEDDMTKVSLVLEDPTAELLAVGVWGRVFQRDVMDPNGSRSTWTIMNSVQWVFTLHRNLLLLFSMV